MSKSGRGLVYLAMLTALTMLATMFLKIPSGIGGYMNLGDAVILLGGIVIGPWAAVAAALGSACADLLLGYMSYIPATFVIKGVMGLIAGNMLYRKIKRGRAIAWMALCEVVMIAGYFLYELCLFGAGYAVASIPPNLLQAALSVAAAAALAPLGERVKKSLK